MFNNRYVKLSTLTIAIAIVLSIIIWLVGYVTGIYLPSGLAIMLSLLGAGYVVYQFFAQHIY